MKRNENIRMNYPVEWTRPQLHCVMRMHGHNNEVRKDRAQTSEEMSFRLYFKPVSSLPKPEETGLGAVATNEANKAVQRVLDEQRSQQPSSKRRKYTAFGDEQRAKVGKYAAEIGNSAALRKFRLELPNLGESTVRFFKKRYLDELPICSGAAVTTIPSRKRGRPLTLCEIDEEVQKFIRALRKAGTPINTSVVLAAAEEIVVSKHRTKWLEGSWNY